MAITRDLANAYFGTNISGELWTRYSEERKQAAIDHAQRFLSTCVEGDLDTDTTSDGDFPRNDCAVYEQALYTLQNAPGLPDIDSPTPTDLFGTKEGMTNKRDTGNIYSICKPARFFLCKGQISVSRG